MIIPSLGVGGLERMAINIANALVRNGYDVTVYNLTYHDQDMRKLFDEGVQYFSEYFPKKFITHANLSDIIHFRFRILPSSVWFYMHRAKYIHNVFVKEKFDIEIAFYYGAPAQIVCGAPKSTKKVFWVHEIPSAIRQKDSNRVRLFSEHRAIDSMDIAVCVSENFQKEMENEYKCNKVITVPNLSDFYGIQQKANEKPEDIVKNRFTIVFVGRIDIQHKGIDRLLEAVKQLNAEGKEFDVWIVGDGSDRLKVESIIQNENLNNVKVYGLKANPYPYMKAADVLVLASRWEAYGLVMAESIILGTPVLATECAGSMDILSNGEYGMIVENSSKGITDGLRRLISDHELYERYVVLAKERSEYFKPETIINKIKEVLL